MNGPTWEDVEREAIAQDEGYDRYREDKMLNPEKYSYENEAAPICNHRHDIADGGYSAAKFNEFTESLRRAKA